MADSIEQLGFELTTAALAEQERALARLKSCAGTVLGASSVAGSYLGASTSNGSLNPWTILALVSFVFCFGCAVWVLLPHYLVFAVGGRSFLPTVTVARSATCPRHIAPPPDGSSRSCRSTARKLLAYPVG